MIRRRRDSTTGSGIGIAERSATVYGWNGKRFRSRELASSTIRPRYITAIRSLMWRTTDRSWAMNRYVRSNSPWRRSRRLMIWAWIETSSALIGSSATIRSGFTASAGDADPLALTAGELVRVALAEVGLSPTVGQELARTRSWRSVFVPTSWISERLADDAGHVHPRVQAEYGSWKIICIRRRIAGALPLSPEMSSRRSRSARRSAGRAG
jgi:hypothetical protein